MFQYHRIFFHLLSHYLFHRVQVVSKVFIELLLLGIECGSVVNNSLSSPGYPNNYPKNMNCSYSVPIPEGMALVINFDDFNLVYHPTCR